VSLATYVSRNLIN